MHIAHFLFRNISTQTAINPISKNVNPIAPYNAMEFANTGQFSVMLANGFHGKPVNAHSRIHNTNAQVAAKTNGRAHGTVRTVRTATNGTEKMIPPANAIPTSAGTVHIANWSANSGTTNIEFSIHQNMATP